MVETSGEFQEGEFAVISGPAPWYRKDMTYHVSGIDVHRVLTKLIENKILLFRNPYHRVLSMWKYQIGQGNTEMDFGEWLEDAGRYPGDWRMQMVEYCEDFDELLFTVKLSRRLYILFGVEWSELHVNRSKDDRGVAHRDLIKRNYPDDVRVWSTCE